MTTLEKERHFSWKDIPREEILHYPRVFGSCPCLYCGTDCAEQCVEIITGRTYAHVSCYVAYTNRSPRKDAMTEKVSTRNEHMTAQFQIEYIKTVAALLDRDATGVDLEELEQEIRATFGDYEWELIERAALRVAEGRQNR